jgi:uncharacterized protein (TIGR02265 family)
MAPRSPRNAPPTSDPAPGPSSAAPAPGPSSVAPASRPSSVAPASRPSSVTPSVVPASRPSSVTPALGTRSPRAARAERLAGRRLTARYDEPIDVVVDPADRVNAVPRDHAVKGMFLADLVRQLGAEWPALVADLAAPPRFGRYLPFADYPRVDHVRLMYAVARARHPHARPAQGARLLARREAQTFLNSLVGKALLAPVSTPKGALLSAPKGYQLVVKGGAVRVIDLGERRVRLEYRDYAGWVEGAVIGLIEGMLAAFEAQAEFEVEFLSDADANYELRW